MKYREHERDRDRCAHEKFQSGVRDAAVAMLDSVDQSLHTATLEDDMGLQATPRGEKQAKTPWSLCAGGF